MELEGHRSTLGSAGAHQDGHGVKMAVVVIEQASQEVAAAVAADAVAERRLGYVQ